MAFRQKNDSTRWKALDQVAVSLACIARNNRKEQVDFPYFRLPGR